MSPHLQRSARSIKQIFVFSVCFSLPVCLSVCLLSVCLLSVSLSVSVCKSVCLSVCLYVCLSVCLSVVCVSVCLSVCTSVSVCLFVCQYVCVKVQDWMFTVLSLTAVHLEPLSFELSTYYKYCSVILFESELNGTSLCTFRPLSFLNCTSSSS